MEYHGFYSILISDRCIIDITGNYCNILVKILHLLLFHLVPHFDKTAYMAKNMSL